MTSRATKRKRAALPGVPAMDLIRAGALDPHFHLTDPIDEKYRKLQAGRQIDDLSDRDAL